MIDNSIAINEIIKPLLGREAWGTELGYGSFVTIEFGLPVKTEAKSDRRHGEWNLWLYGCGWRLEQGDQILAGSEDPREKIISAVQVINGLKLLDVSVNGPAFDTVFQFEKDTRILTFQLETAEMESWFLYFPDPFVLIVGPGSHCDYRRSDI